VRTELRLLNSSPLGLASIGLVLAAIAITVYPEPPANRVTPSEGWKVEGAADSRVNLLTLSDTTQLLRRSVQRDPEARFWRTWTPSQGTQPLHLQSPPFVAPALLSVPVTGETSGSTGPNAVWLEQTATGQRLPVYFGSAHNSFNDVIVALPPKWVGTEVTIGLSSEGRTNVGVGCAFSVPWISYLKSSMLGRLLPLIASMAMYGLLLFTGAAAAVVFGQRRLSPVTALLSLGLAALGVFYASQIMQRAGVSNDLSVRIPVGLLLLVCLSCLWRWRRSLSSVRDTVMPFAWVWIVSTLALAALLGMAQGGAGHWEPNFRFWPATWSSDHELPWRYAEAIRGGHRLAGIYGGGWMPTDRPPLMASALLMASEVVDVSTRYNDGHYLKGVAYNTIAIGLNSLWLPLAYWLLRDCMGFKARHALAVLVFAATVPFSLFTTIYGWPKAFGAAYALACFGLLMCRPDAVPYRSGLTFAAVCGALSMLAHASVAFFLAPLAILAWLARPRGAIATMVAALVVACSIMGTWSIYKQVVLPSLDPVTKYALTGDYGFGRSDLSVVDMVRARYSTMTLNEWLGLKRSALVGALVPMAADPSKAIEPYLVNASLLDTLRAWDFHVPTIGNGCVLICTTFAAILVCVMRGGHAHIPQGSAALLTVSLSGFVLYVLICLAPAILHTLPHPAWFGLAIASGAIVAIRAPRTLATLLTLQLAYVAIVWFVHPLLHALSIDLTATLMLALVAAIAVRHSKFFEAPPERRSDAECRMAETIQPSRRQATR
jgi:hypothetical protein